MRDRDYCTTSASIDVLGVEGSWSQGRKGKLKREKRYFCCCAKDLHVS
jgi:hypothetical protein